MSDPIAEPDRSSTAFGLDPARLEALVADGLRGVDDGELFLEYSQSESFAFDDGRLKSASFDTTQGFGLRAVAGEAIGYAHSPELERGGACAAPPRPSPRSGPAMAARCAAAARHQPPPLHRGQPARACAIGRQGRAARRRSTPMPAPRTRASGRSSRRSRRLAGGRDHARPTAAAPPTSGRWCGSTSASWSATDGRMESGSHGAGGRFGYDAAARAREVARAGRRGAAPGAGQARLGRRAGRRDDRRARRRAGPASCCTRRSATASRATSTARRPRPSPA